VKVIDSQKIGFRVCQTNPGLFVFRNPFLRTTGFVVFGFQVLITVKPIYIDRQVIRQSIMHLFPVAGSTPGFISRGRPPDRLADDFFPPLLGLSWWRNGWRSENQTTGGRVWEHYRKCPNKGSRAFQIIISPTSGVLEDHRVGVHQVLNTGTGRRPRNGWSFTFSPEWYPDLVKMWNASFDMLGFGPEMGSSTPLRQKGKIHPPPT
jgi:hypothetical protein